MDVPIWIWISAVSSISLSAVAQLLMKMGMTKVRLAGPSGSDAMITTATSPLVIAGLGLYGIGAMLWLVVLSRVPLSMAYPLVSLGFVFVALLSWMFLGETLPAARTIGIGLILAGVALVGRTT